ncbi:MAG: PDZ domain-containing protein [Phycisphaerales bacterium]
MLACSLLIATALATSSAPAPQVNTELSLSPTARNGDGLPSDETLKKRPVSQATLDAVAALDSPEFARRRDATDALRTDGVELDELLAVLARGGLSPEAQHRLVAVTTERILTQFGALGVQMDVLARGVEGVRITGCVQGMPAEKFLQVEDVIVAIDGRAVRDAEGVTAIVQSLAPGTTVRVEVLRVDREANGKPKLDATGRPVSKRVEVSFPLGSARQLEAAYVGGAPRMRVSLERQDMARAVMRRYAPQPIIVTMPEDRAASEKFAALDPDAHPDVQGLKRLKDIYEAERRPWDANTLNAVEATLVNLRRQADDPTYPEAQREWFKRVVKRFEQLMPRPE